MKERKLPSIVSIIILTLLTIILWVSFSIYRALTSKPSPVVPTEVSQPLTPTLDSDAITKIESRIFIQDSDIPDNVATGAVSTPKGSIAPTQTPLATPQATESATPLPTP